MGQNAYMSALEAEDWRNGTICKIGDYTIKPKRDFGSTGFWDAPTRSHISMGWVIVKDGCLATPGAGWYKTMTQAKAGVGLLMASKGDAEVYHGLNQALRYMIEADRENQKVAEKAAKEREGMLK